MNEEHLIERKLRLFLVNETKSESPAAAGLVLDINVERTELSVLR